MNIVIAFVSVGLLVLADQIAKIIATLALADGTVVPVLGSFLELSYTRNTGAAWGMMSGSRWLLIAAPIVAMLICLWALFANKVRHNTGIFAILLVTAGGLGNLIDRIFQPGGAVVDYIHFNFAPLFDFPVFNFADICVTFGGIFLVIYLFFYFEKDHPSKKKAAVTAENGSDASEQGHTVGL